ncbi:MAG: hypothetical protein AB7F43_13190 [Bacteriovoracia bacterium]
MRKARILLASLLILAPSAHALKFTNQFVEFELPTKWNCSLEGAEWVCQSTNDQQKRDAIIVLAAKLKGPQDTLDQYQDYLGKPRNFTAPNGKAVSSKPKYAKIIQLNGQPWVDAIHMESELPDFYTRYLATIKQDIGILVTYSIYKTKYQEYLSEFETMVKSMKAFRKPGGVNTNIAQSIFNTAPMPGNFTAQNLFPENKPPGQPGGNAPVKTKKKGGDDLMLYLIIGAAAAGFIIWRKKRGGGNS